MSLFQKVFKLLLATALICSCTIGVYASESTVVPTKPDDYYVYDMADVINDTTSESISLYNVDELSDYGEIVIVTILSSGDTTLADYSQELFDTWEIGGDDSSGALLVMDIDGDNYRSILGSGFSSYVSESQLQDILDGQVEYYFDSKDYNSAASIFTSAIMSKVILTDDTSDTDETDEAATDEAATDETATDEAATDEAATDEAATDEATEEDEKEGNSVASAILTFFKVILIIILILLVIVVVFLVLVNYRSKQRKRARKSRRNK